MFSLTACGNSSIPTPSKPDPGTAIPENGGGSAAYTLGLVCSNFADTHLTNVRKIISELCDLEGIVLLTYDSNRDSGAERDGFNNYITQKVDVVAGNVINGQAVDEIVYLFRDAGIPIIIFNSSTPSNEALVECEHAYFVNSAAEESGKIQGWEAAKYWNENQKQADRNRNGKFDYVILRGAPGIYETFARTEWCVRAAVEEDVPMNEIIWEGSESSEQTAQEMMFSILASHKKDIEVVFADNDEMAIGAIDALKTEGFLTGEPSDYIPVYGVGATRIGIEALKTGDMAATSLNDPVAMGYGIMSIVLCLRDGKEVHTENFNAAFPRMPEFGMEVGPRKRVWTHYRAVTAENCDDIYIGI